MASSLVSSSRSSSSPVTSFLRVAWAKYRRNCFSLTP